MRKLSNAEYAAVVAAIERKPHEKRYFTSGVNKMNVGSALRPDFAKAYPDFPWRLTDFRAETTWSLGHVERHQAACDAAAREYWRVMTANAEVSGRTRSA